MLVDFVLRDNSERKGGGDLVQIQTYATLLETMGWDVRLLPYSPRLELRAGAITHVVNVDRPFDALSVIRQAGTRPIYVSSIHHSLRAVRRMRASEAGLGVRSFLGRVLPESFREFLSFSVRGVLNTSRLGDRARAVMESARLLAAAPRVWSVLGAALDRVDGVFLLAEGERENLREDTGWRGFNGIIAPNGVPAAISNEQAWGARSNAVLVVGRVEPRKRQLDLVRAAAGRPISLTLVGELQQPGSLFGREFAAALEDAPNVTWLGPMEHEEVAKLMGAAKIVLNPSWVEVQSLVELEAALAGAWVVGSADAGNSGEWLPEAYRGVQGDSVDAMLMAAQEILWRDQPPLSPEYDWTWMRTVKVLDAAYRNAMRVPGT